MMCRAEVFGYLCFATALNLLAAYLRTDRIRYLAWLVPLTVLWVNLHGSFLILLGLMPLFCAGLFLDAWRRSSFRGGAIVESLRARRVTVLLGAWLLVGVATLVNPYGLDLIPSTLDQSTSQLWKQVIIEWQPLYERDFVPRRFIVAVSALAVAMVAGWRRLPFVSHLMALTLTALAVSSYRHLAVFGLGSAFVLAQFAGGLKLERRLRPAVAVALVALLIGANAHAARVVSFSDRSLERNPSRFVTRRGIDFIRRHVRGNVLNRWVLGGVLIYYAYPQVRVCIDSRADPYPPSYFRAYRRAIAGTAKDTLGFVNRYGIDHIIIDQKLFDTTFRAKLQNLEGFQPVFGDGKMVVLSREPRS